MIESIYLIMAVILVNDNQWKEFVIGDTFELINSSSYHKSDVVETDEENKLPYVTRTSLNNGIEMHIKRDNSFNINSGNQIVFGAENADFFYQEHPFVTGNKMYLLQHERMNKPIGLFLVNTLRNAIKGSGFGYSLGMTATRLSNRKVLLPATKNGTPNWEYMEEQGKQKYESKQDYILEYLKMKHSELKTQLSKVSEPMIEEKTWETFKVEEMFNVKRVSGEPLNKYEDGNLPFISTSSLKNGVQGFVSSKIEDISPKKSLTISPIDGTIFFHPYKFVGRGGAGSSISTMSNENLNKYTGLFIKAMIESSSKYKASYGVQLNGNRLKSTKFYLPITVDNEPNWKFMEYYMKRIEYEQLTKLIEYLN